MFRSRGNSTVSMVLFLMMLVSTSLMYYWMQKARALERQVDQWNAFAKGQGKPPIASESGWGGESLAEVAVKMRDKWLGAQGTERWTKPIGVAVDTATSSVAAVTANASADVRTKVEPYAQRAEALATVANSLLPKTAELERTVAPEAVGHGSAEAAKADEAPLTDNLPALASKGASGPSTNQDSAADPFSAAEPTPPPAAPRANADRPRSKPTAEAWTELGGTTGNRAVVSNEDSSAAVPEPTPAPTKASAPARIRSVYDLESRGASNSSAFAPARRRSNPASPAAQR